MPDAAQVMNPGQVPECPGAPGVLQEDLAPQLGRSGVGPHRVGVVGVRAQGLHSPVGGVAVEESQQREDNHSAHRRNNPEGDLPAGKGNQESQGGSGDGRAHAADGLLKSDGNAQLPLEPGRHGCGNVHRKQGLGQAKDHAVVEVKLPELGHGAQQQHSGHVQGGGNQQRTAGAVTVSRPAGHGGQQGIGDTAQHLGQHNGADRPAKVLLQHHQDYGKGLADEVGGNAQGRAGAHDHPGVVVLFAQGIYPVWPAETQPLVLP